MRRITAGWLRNLNDELDKPLDDGRRTREHPLFRELLPYALGIIAGLGVYLVIGESLPLRIASGFLLVCAISGAFFLSRMRKLRKR